MPSLLKFAIAMVLLAGWALAALSLHVVRTATAVHLIPKNELSIADTYVDVRTWSSADEATHPALFARLKQLDQTSLLDPVATATPLNDEPGPVIATASTSNIGRSWYRPNPKR